MLLANAAAGADGLIIEVHNDPAHALCDGAQSLTPKDFAKLSKIPVSLAQTTLLLLTEMKIVARTGKQGRAYVYELLY